MNINNFYDAWNYLCQHPMFQNNFNQCLDIEVVKINPKTKEIDLNKYFSFDNNKRVVEINGVILSQNRIKRNILKLENSNLSDYDKAIYSLIYGSILTEEEYANITSNSKDITKNITK